MVGTYKVFMVPVAVYIGMSVVLGSENEGEKEGGRKT